MWPRIAGPQGVAISVRLHTRGARGALPGLGAAAFSDMAMGVRLRTRGMLPGLAGNR